MANERAAIESPLWINFEHMPVPPLRFFLQQEYKPTGVVESAGDGITVSHSPWFTEVAWEVKDLDLVALLYLLPMDDETMLLIACLEESVEPLFKLLSGPDFGDELTKLVALRWPEQYAMLMHSQSRTPGARLLCNITTPEQVQWVVADQLRGQAREEIHPGRVIDLVGASLETFLRMTNPGTELPGIVHVLGGPDRLTRRLNAVAGLLGGAGDVLGVFVGGVQVTELVSLAKSAYGVVTDLQKLRD